MLVAVATPNIGVVKVLLDNVSEPASVASVPVVGRVNPVVPVDVKVIALAPEVIKDDPSANVKVAPVAGAVIVILFMLVAVATPNTGVTRVGEVFITKVVPVPVCKAIEVALPTDVIGPVRFAFVVTVSALFASIAVDTEPNVFLGVISPSHPGVPVPPMFTPRYTV